MVDNSEPAWSKNKKYSENPGKVKVLHYVLCESDFSIAHEGKNDINRHNDTKDIWKGICGCCTKTKKISQFW